MEYVFCLFVSTENFVECSFTWKPLLYLSWSPGIHVHGNVFCTELFPSNGLNVTLLYYIISTYFHMFTLFTNMTFQNLFQSALYLNCNLVPNFKVSVQLVLIDIVHFNTQVTIPIPGNSFVIVQAN
jgi:hypothetical protein